MILKYLSLSERNILQIKLQRQINNIDNKIKMIKKILLYKFRSFFIISFIFLLFFWYYLSCFGAVYKNTQLHLIKDTLISFSFSLISPFIFYSLPGLFRITSLKKNNKEIMYKFSKIIQTI